MLFEKLNALRENSEKHRKTLKFSLFYKKDESK